MMKFILLVWPSFLQNYYIIVYNIFEFYAVPVHSVSILTGSLLDIPLELVMASPLDHLSLVLGQLINQQARYRLTCSF